MSLETDLKAKHGRVFRAHIEGHGVYFRLLNRSEYDRAARLTDAEGKLTPVGQEFILNTAVLSPDLSVFDNYPAGCLSGLAFKIAGLSAFDDLPAFANQLKERRLACGLLSEQVFIFIMRAMPVYKLEDLEKKPYDELARLLAMSEEIVGQRLPVQGAEVEEEKKPLLDERKTDEELRRRALKALQQSRKG